MKKLLIFIPVFCLLVGCAPAPTGNAETPRNEIIIALLDTGISSVAISAENVRAGHNYVTGTDDTEDRINHGTAVASIILGCESAGVKGAAPHAAVVPLVIADKADGEERSVTPETLARAVRDSVDVYGACIINVSLGLKTDVTALREAVEYVQSKGALVVAAAGNDGANGELYYPAAYDGVIAVGSHDKDLKISSFCPNSERIDLLAPGEDVMLASRNGKTYGAKGTSYATAYVSAAALLVWEKNTSFTAEQVKTALLTSAPTTNGKRILAIPATAEH